MAIKYVGINHIAIRAKDMELEKAFYSDVLQLREVCALNDETGAEKIVFYQVNPGQTIELVRSEGKYSGYSEKLKQSHWHCCFEFDARHEAYRDFERRNIQCRHNSEDTVAFDGSWTAFVEDPEHNEWELMEFSPISKQIHHLPNNLNPKE